jgi:hypothetical protein
VATEEVQSTCSRKQLEPEPFGAMRLDRLNPNDIEI